MFDKKGYMKEWHRRHKKEDKEYKLKQWYWHYNTTMGRDYP